MLKVALAFAVPAALVAGFFALPTETTWNSYSYECHRTAAQITEAVENAKRAQAERKRRQAEDAKSGNIYFSLLDDLPDFDPLKPPPATYTVSVYKSGLRRAIEGRLLWLGFDGHLGFLDKDACPT